MNDDCLQTIVKLLVEHSDSPKTKPEQIDIDQPVFGASGVISDSLQILDVLTAIEKEFRFQVPDEDLTEELFSSIRVFSDYVREKAVLV